MSSDFDDSFEIPLDGLDVDNVSGFAQLKAGSYHAKIVKAEPEGGPKGELTVDLEVLAGTTANQEGKIHREFFTKDTKDFNRRKMLAMALAGGALTTAELQAAKAQGANPKPQWGRMIGKHVCFNAERNEYPEGSGKFKTRFVWSEVYAVADPKAADIPKHVAMLKADGINLPANLIPGAAAAAPKPNPVTGNVAGGGTPKSPPAAADADPLGGVDLSVA